MLILFLLLIFIFHFVLLLPDLVLNNLGLKIEFLDQIMILLLLYFGEVELLKV